jgi:hypothetical protein
MDEATAAKTDLSNAVFSISLADLYFNLEKKNTSKSKRAVGADELRRVIASIELQTSSSDPTYVQINTHIAPVSSTSTHQPLSLETDSAPRKREISAERQPLDSEKLDRTYVIPETITTEESAWTEGFNATNGLFEEEVVKGTEVMRVVEAKGPRATTPELENTQISRSISPLRIANLEDDSSPSTPKHPIIETICLPPSSLERSPEPSHHPSLPVHIESMGLEGEIEPCPTAFPPKAKKPKRQKPIPTFETIQQMEIPPVPRPAKPPKPEKVDVGLEPLKVSPALDIGGRDGVEIKQKGRKEGLVLDIGGRVGVEIKREERKEAPQPSSPATEPKEREDSVQSKHIVTGAAKHRTSIQPLQNTTLSSLALSLTTKATGSPRSEDERPQFPLTPVKRPGTAASSLPPESPFDLPVRLKPSHQLRTSLETLESLSIPANPRSPTSSLLHQTSLETLEYVTVAARAKGELTLQNAGMEAVQPQRGRERLKTNEVGVSTPIKTSSDQVTETEVKVGLSSWTMSLFPPAKPLPSLALQSTLSDYIQPLLPPTPARNRRRRKQDPSQIVYRQAAGEKGALFQLTPTIGRMVKVKEYVVINEESRDKVSFPPLYSPDVVHAMALQRRVSHKGLPRERVALSPFRAGDSFRGKEYYMRCRGGMGSVGSRAASRDAPSESPEKAFRKAPKLTLKLL